MKAAVWHAQRDMRLEDIPEPEVGPEDVKIKVAYAGICHTDVFEYLYGPQTIFNPPLALGHEFSGVVEEVGEAVTGLAKGDPVTGLPYYPCWECIYCQQDLWNLCPSAQAHGMHIHGAFAEYVPLHYKGVYKLPEGVSLEEAATVEPTSVVYRAIKRSGLKEGESVHIVGAGPVGLLLTNVAKYKGAGKIVVSEPLESRRQKALEMGATHVLNPEVEDPITRTHEICDGVGAHVSFDCVGMAATLDTAVYSTRRNGRIGILGFGFYESPTYPLMLLAAFASEYTYFATLGYNVEMKEVVDLVGKGELHPGDVISNIIPFDQMIDFFDHFEENRRKYLKILIKIG
ncbi:MAG: alcohol dehydrogenase catalytic domain-containing protein [Actinobacteria bacterium]|nr:alcohol dehydrogenase catalytic domain-containing protein [Actinomycetota bacterium]